MFHKIIELHVQVTKVMRLQNYETPFHKNVINNVIQAYPSTHVHHTHTHTHTHTHKEKVNAWVILPILE
jgi:hypothetical protein